jgi:uncharacterized membrane protein
MNNYPEVVTRVTDDYLERVRTQLRLVPSPERDEFLKEIQSHLFEAYQRMPGEDELTRILAVLRNFGEPADVVADRLPESMLRAGSKRNMPLYVAGGIFLALFGLPLGFGGIGVLLGLLGALAGVLVAYFAVTGSILLVGALLLLLGFIRLVLPRVWDSLIAIGVIQFNGPAAGFVDQFSAQEQGLIILMAGAVLGAAGTVMLWGGKHLFRGLRFLASLAFDWVRRQFEALRRKLRPQSTPRPRAAASVETPKYV